MSKVNFNALKMMYEPNVVEDDENMYNLKEIISKLNEAEQRIMLLYVDSGSYSEVARQMNCTSPTAKTYIERVKNKIIKILEDEYDY